MGNNRITFDDMLSFKHLIIWYRNKKKKRPDASEDHTIDKPPFGHFSEKQKKNLQRLLKKYSAEN
jgi:hypothetical protein